MDKLIKSRKLKQEFHFWMPSEGGYVWLGNGTLGRQLCAGGGFVGATLTATPDTFDKVCRKWYRQHIAGVSNG